MQLKSIKLLVLPVAITLSLNSTFAIEDNMFLPDVDKKPPPQEDIFSRDANVSSSNLEFLKKNYKDITKEENIMQALEVMKGTLGNYSRDAIMGNNILNKPIKIEFKNLAEINPKYSSFDALGWKKSNRLYIYLNEKHSTAPPEALAALLSHEALHQDELDSLNEETYAWTMEAAVWTQLTDKNPSLQDHASPLVTRENMLRQLFEKGNYTNKYLKKAVFSNVGYRTLPTRSPGFEDRDIEDL